MNFKNKYQQAAWNHKVSPSDHAWKRLEAKIEQQKSARTVIKYRHISVAAIVISILCVMTLFYNQKKHEVRENDNVYNVEVIKFSNTDEVGIYDLYKLQSLKIAYAKQAEKRKI